MTEKVGEKKRTSPAVWAALAVVIGFPLLAAWELLFSHSYVTHTPRTASQAQAHCPIALPLSAHDVYVATYRHFQAYVQYVRFEAPTADCEAYAKVLMPSDPLIPISQVDFTPLNPEGLFGTLEWFDVKSLKKGKQAGNAGPSQPVIFIDSDRGIFYYSITD